MLTFYILVALAAVALFIFVMWGLLEPPGPGLNATDNRVEPKSQPTDAMAR
jgi:hypothetical protein